MWKEKFGISLGQNVVQENGELTDECDDLRASRSEVIEAVLTAYPRSDAGRGERVPELITEKRELSNYKNRMPCARRSCAVSRTHMNHSVRTSPREIIEGCTTQRLFIRRTTIGVSSQ